MSYNHNETNEETATNNFYIPFKIIHVYECRHDRDIFEIA